IWSTISSGPPAARDFRATSFTHIKPIKTSRLLFLSLLVLKCLPVYVLLDSPTLSVPGTV
ncbi:unnamed protein product, partial [Callosobruchus maculatus]